jgi:hypothetical protein
MENGFHAIPVRRRAVVTQRNPPSKNDNAAEAAMAFLAID